MTLSKVGEEEPAPTHLLVQPADLFLHFLSPCGQFLAAPGPCRQSGVKGCSERRRHKSRAWAEPLPVAGEAEDKRRGSSGVSMMGKPNSQAGFEALWFP